MGSDRLIWRRYFVMIMETGKVEHVSETGVFDSACPIQLFVQNMLMHPSRVNDADGPQKHKEHGAQAFHCCPYKGFGGPGAIGPFVRVRRTLI